MAKPAPGRLLAVMLGLALAAACQPREASSPRDAEQAGGWPQAAAPLPTGEEPKRGGTLSMAISKDITVLNPLVRTASTDKWVRDLMFESLLAMDEQGNIQPRLAERWEVTHGGTLFTLHLRRGIKFHHGQEMTAQDARFAMHYVMDPRNGAYGHERLALIDRVEAPEPYRLEVYLKRPSAAFLASLTNITAHSVIPDGSLQQGTDKQAAFPPGTGPFRFVEWQPKQRVVLERNDDYWGQKAYVDRVILRPIDDTTVRMTAVRSGDVDMAERTPYEWVREIMDGKVRGVGYAEAGNGVYRTLLFNVADPPFNNKKLRQAVAHAIDKRELLQAIYYGFGEPIDQKYPKGHVWHMEGLPTPSYDPDKARVLLREAGYEGQPITLMLEQGQEFQTAGTTVQAQLKKVGIDVRLEVLEYGTYTERHRKGEFAFRTGGAKYESDPSSTYGPELRCEPDRNRRGQNRAGYCEPEVDALLEQIEVELDPARRKALVRQVLTRLADDVSELPIGFAPRFFTFRDYVKGFTTNDEAEFIHFSGGVDRTWLDK
jgi:peptide/nickel transport system substrate-binding protein